MHMITSLNNGGGAETMLLRLLEELGDGRDGHHVFSLRPRGMLASRVEELGVPVGAFGMRSRPAPADVMRLGRVIRESRPAVIQTWMLHSNVLVGLAARMVSRSPVVWGVHLTEVDRSTLGTKAALIQRFEALSSWSVPSRIVACSISSEQAMLRLRYRRNRIVTIPNGFDLAQFRPDPAAREEVRRELGIPPGSLVIGHVARFHRVKDHPTLVAAAAKVFDRCPDARLVLCGPHIEPDNAELMALVAPLGDRVLLLGRRTDVPRVLNAFDVGVSSSSGEALSLAIGETMATGVPMVATRCGDAEEVIGDTGELTPIGDPAALAEALLRLLAMDPERAG